MLAQAAVEHPDEMVRTASFPVVGEGTLRDLVREAKANQRAFPGPCPYGAALRLRPPLPADAAPLLAALEFQCNNTVYRPVMDALDLLARYDGVDGKHRFYAPADQPPIDRVVPAAWREAVVDEQGRMERVPYELCVLVALRDAVRRREVYVAGGLRWRNPEDDLRGVGALFSDEHPAINAWSNIGTSGAVAFRKNPIPSIFRIDDQVSIVVGPAALLNWRAGCRSSPALGGAPWPV